MKIILVFKLLFLLFTKNLCAQPLVTIDWVAKNNCKSSVKILEIGKSFNSYKVEHIACSNYTNFYNDKWRIKKTIRKLWNKRNRYDYSLRKKKMISMLWRGNINFFCL